MTAAGGRPRIAVCSLGGTITMTGRSSGTGVVPTLDAADLVAEMPALGAVAQVTATTVQTVPGAWLLPTDVLAVADWARSQVDAGADGVVVVQGTDTIEESAYLLDLHWDRPHPLVVTGAMRPPSAPGADGPANLLAAVTVAADDAARDRGVLVVLDDVVHAAVRVRKTDSMSSHAFDSGSFGALGRLHEGRTTYAGPPARWPALPRPVPGASPRVALVEAVLGDGGTLLRLAVEDGYDGVVVAAFGAGHVSAAMADDVGAAVLRCPVVLASRTGDGPVLTGTYGFVGSEQDLLARGAVPAGWLSPRRARLLLWSLLAAGADPEAVRETVRARGAAPAGPR